MKTLKEKWITAMEETLHEYGKGTHRLSKCKLCEINKEECLLCPMNVFSDSKGCMYRNLECMTSSSISNLKYKAALIEFYKKAIELFKACKMSKVYNNKTKSKWAQGIKEIDTQVAEKYKLI